MSPSRREQDRGRRRDLIVEHARALAEAEGWEAVTVRRLAEGIQYSQPVLYSHFGGREEIVREVALQGFAELADQLRAVRSGKGDDVRRVCAAYLAFAAEHPAVYQAMFEMAVGLPFAAEDTPEPLLDGFAQIQAMVGGDGTRAEVAWSALHGLASLGRDGRLPASNASRRLDVLVELLSAR